MGDFHRDLMALGRKTFGIGEMDIVGLDVTVKILFFSQNEFSEISIHFGIKRRNLQYYQFNLNPAAVQ